MTLSAAHTEHSSNLAKRLLNTRIIVWDKDGTITGSLDPNDKSKTSSTFLPNVASVMNRENGINIICSGCKTPESERQNFDPEKVASKLQTLMTDFPICAATFSPAIGGVECYLILKLNENVEIIKIHEQERYKKHQGSFKKPGIGMLVVIQDLIEERLSLSLKSPSEIIFIGDTWHDEEAAKSVGFSFVHANDLHNLESREF